MNDKTEKKSIKRRFCLMVFDLLLLLFFFRALCALLYQFCIMIYAVYISCDIICEAYKNIGT